MAKEPEVIQTEMEETRSALADKLGALTEKISGTVETVQETVQGITGTVENVEKNVEKTVKTVADTVQGITGTVESVEQTVEKTVEAVASTVGSVGETAQEAVQSVKEAFDFPKQYDRHPWLFFGGSVLAGFVGGRMLFTSLQEPAGSHTSARAADHMGEYMARSSGQTAHQAVDYTSQSAQTWDQGMGQSHNGHGDTAQAETGSWFGGMFEKFMPDLTKLKELALGTLFATARDLISQNLPDTLKSDVMNVFNDMASHAGGKPIQGSILGEGNEQQAGQNENSGQNQNAGGNSGQTSASGQTSGKKGGQKAGAR